MRRLGLAALLLVGLSSTSCHRAQRTDPLPVVRRYLDQTADGQVDAAYAALSDDFKRRCDRGCFARILTAQRPELIQARAQVRAGEARVETQARLTLGDGTVLQLVQAGEPPQEKEKEKEKGLERAASPFLFAESPLEFYPQDTPERTLRSFMRAVQARRYEALLRFIPQSLEEQYTLATLRERFDGPGRTALIAQLDSIGRHLSEPFIFDKDGRLAKLPIGDGKEARLLFEDGRWRVLQLE